MHFLHGAILLCMCLASVSSSHAQSFDLQEYRWKNRVLVVFAEQETTTDYQSLVREIEELSDEFSDRDMVLVSLFEQGTSLADGVPISVEDTRRLRDQFDVAPGDYVIYLIGKDGGIKQQGGKGMRINSLFALIDTMPMRRSEMRKKSKG